MARVPFHGPIGAVRLGRVDGQLVAFPTAEELENSDLDLVVASTEQAVVMIEGFGEELPENEMGDAIMEAHRLNQEVIALQKELAQAAGLPPWELPETPIDPLRQTIYARYGEQLRQTKQIVMKGERNAAARELLNTIIKELVPTEGSAASPVGTEAPAGGPEGEAGHAGDSAPSPVPADTPVTPAASRRPSRRSRSGSSAS